MLRNLHCNDAALNPAGPVVPSCSLDAQFALWLTRTRGFSPWRHLRPLLSAPPAASAWPPSAREPPGQTACWSCPSERTSAQSAQGQRNNVTPTTPKKNDVDKKKWCEMIKAFQHGQDTAINTTYPSGQLLALLLLGDEVLWCHFQLKLGELVFPANGSARGQQ